MSLAAIVKAMAASGCTADQIAAAVEASEAQAAAAIEARRVKARDKKRRQRAALSPDVPGTEGDEQGRTGTRPPDGPPFPQTPNPPLNPPVSLRSTVAREPDDILVEFDQTFWPAYPNKVGKPKALASFRKARRAASLDQIMAGLSRYRASKPADRQWLNPATFLNQERFNDQPAGVSATGPPRAEQSNGIASLYRRVHGIPNERTRPPDDEYSGQTIDLRPTGTH